MKNYIKYRPSSFEKRGNWIHNWFSNMLPAEIWIDGKKYPSTENYYQSMKTLDPVQQDAVIAATPNKSKKMGRLVTKRPDWELVKYEVMKTALRAKFNIPEWRDKLLATGEEMIIEWNNWGDRTWGVSVTDNLGDNLLGQALMEIRGELTTYYIQGKLDL